MFEQELNNYWKIVVDTIQDGVMIGADIYVAYRK